MTTLTEICLMFINSGYEVMTIFDGLIKLGTSHGRDPFNLNLVAHIESIFKVGY
jgi:hypothetical protein